MNPYLEYVYILKTRPDSVSEITKHEVISYANSGYTSFNGGERVLVVEYTIEDHYPVRIPIDKPYHEEMHLTSVIGNMDPWTGSTWAFRNLEDANLQREKELKRINLRNGKS